MTAHASKAELWYQPVRPNRVLNHRSRYEPCGWDWNDEAAAIEGFKLQLEDFYILPVERLLNHDDGLFMAVVLSCILIDTLAQYENQLRHSTQAAFIAWTRKHIPTAKEHLLVDTPHGKKPVSIQYRNPSGKLIEISDYAAAVYYGYRCGILHEAHPYIFCGIAGQCRAIEDQDAIFSCRLNLTKYDDGTPCPTIVVNPSELLKAIKARLDVYFELLAKPKSEEDKLLSVNFKQKFLWSHGINIGKDTK